MDQALAIEYTRLVSKITELPAQYKKTLLYFLVTENLDKKQTEQFMKFMAGLELKKKAH